MNQSTVKKAITASLKESGQRLDVFCVSQMPKCSRSALQRAIKKGEITVNGDTVKPHHTVREGDKVLITMDQKKIMGKGDTSPLTKGGLRGVNIPIIYEDKDVVVVNKPAGIAAHPGIGLAPTASEWFAARYPDCRSIGDRERPGVVHRLDKDTSGVMILAKTQEAFEHLKKKFEKRKVKKEYLALVFGVPGEKGGRITRALSRSKRNPLRRMVSSPPYEEGVGGGGRDLQAKLAITEWKKEEVFGNSYALLRVFPYTGRMHQIRAHLHFLGFPIVGDQLYTFKRRRPPKGVKRQMLHAEKLTLELPNGKQKTFTAPLPQDFSSVLTSLRSGLFPLRNPVVKR